MSERPGNEVCAPHKRRTKKETTTSDATAQSFQSILLEQERKDDTDPSLGMGIKIPHTSLSFTAVLHCREPDSKEGRDEGGGEDEDASLESGARHHQTAFLSPSLVHQVFLVYTSFFPMQRLAISIIIISTFKLG